MTRLSIPSPILQRFRRSGRAILAQTYLATSSLRLSLEGYAFIRGPVLPSRGRYPMISRALFSLFSTYSCTRSIFPLSRLRETRRELSALLSFQNPRIKARAMNGRRTYSSLDTTFNSDETDIRIFQFLRFDLTSVLGAQGERERKKEFCGTSRSGRARVRCGISSSVENNSGKSIVVRRVEWWIEERINSKTNLGRPDVRLNAIARFIFNLLAEESPSMQFKRSRRISFQTRNDDFLFDGRSPLNARVRVRCYKSVEVSALYPAVDVISVDSQLSHVR